MSRAIVRVQLSNAAKAQLDQLCKRWGMTQLAAMSRLVNWFIQQNEVVQVSVLALADDDTQQALARQLLEQLANGPTPPTNPAAPTDTDTDHPAPPDKEQK